MAMNTCQTCRHWAIPRETGTTGQTQEAGFESPPGTPPREMEEVSLQSPACPTSHISSQNRSICVSCCPGTWTAPSRIPRWLRQHHGSWHNLPHSLTAWDKRQRLGEAINPGPEPPRELYLDRKNGQRDPIRLCTQNGGWVWNVHSVPPLRVAKRPTPHEALRNWLTKHENAIKPESAEAARQLAKKWEVFPVPQPTRKSRSLPPREMSSMSLESSYNNSPPRELPPNHPDPSSERQPPRDEPARCVNGKPSQKTPPRQDTASPSTPKPY